MAAPTPRNNCVHATSPLQAHDACDKVPAVAPQNTLAARQENRHATLHRLLEKSS
jgi:hypothetical protein